LEAHRAAVSGVSSDEELINILKYQRGFEAASRLIVTADELLQTLLDMKR
jgi:flagellar hook-associated protein 1 FlgK